MRAYEHRLLQALFGYRTTGTTLKLSEARRSLASGIPAVRDRELTASLVAAGLFESNPLVDNGRLKLVAFALTGSASCWDSGPGTRDRSGAGEPLAGYAAIIASVVLHLASSFGARRSLQATLEASRWQAFERYLQRNSRVLPGPRRICRMPSPLAWSAVGWSAWRATSVRRPRGFHRPVMFAAYAADPVQIPSSFQTVPTAMDVGSPQA